MNLISAKDKQHLTITRKWNTFSLFVLIVLTLNFLSLPVFCDRRRLNLKNLDNSESNKVRECTSIDVRNDIQSLKQIEGCTVIKGFLMIVLIHQKEGDDIGSRYSDYRFPELREITEYVILYYVTELKSIKDMFPNLVVIRGRKLFMNYALGITFMENFEELSFFSLLAIQRGHVFIDDCPKLCNLDRVNWERLTLTPGENHVYKLENCKTEDTPKCHGCESGYCWSDHACQKFENDRVTSVNHCFSSGHEENCEMIIRTKGPDIMTYLHNVPCHSECLGGCYGTSNMDCVVCRGLTDHDACISKCPDDKFVHEEHARCYNQTECSYYGRFTFRNECIPRCPSGYMPTNGSSVCSPCNDIDCKTVCDGPPDYDFVISSLNDAEEVKGCKVISGNLVLMIEDKIDERQLISCFNHVEEITGYLKIMRSHHLTTLRFFEKLKKIGGKTLEYNQFSLIIIDNKNMIELWPAKNLVLVNGGISMHLNTKLCNRIVREFIGQVSHDQNLDKVQSNDQEVLCDPSRLNLFVQVKSQTTVELSWKKDQTDEQVEILYRHIPFGEIFNEFTELDSHVCERIRWVRRLYFQEELQSNATHHIVTINDLQPNTQYVFLLKTFGPNQQASQSLIQKVKTLPDLPPALSVWTTNKTNNSIKIEWNMRNTTPEVVTHYIIEYEEWPEEKELVDTRDYCLQPMYTLEKDRALFIESEDEYEECCMRKANIAVDEQFKNDLHSMYKCGVQTPDNCDIIASNKSRNPQLVPKTQNHFEAIGLRHYTLYTFQVSACNSFGCGRYTLHSDRTDAVDKADLATILQACRFNRSESYVISFSEPPHPNGVILKYILHFRRSWNETMPNSYETRCITRLQHEHHDYNTPITIDESYAYDEIAIRTFSLGGSVISPYAKITQCQKTRDEGLVIIPWTMSSYTVFMIVLMTSFTTAICAFAYKLGFLGDMSSFCRQLRQSSRFRDEPVEDGETLVMRFINQTEDDIEDEIETELDVEIERQIKVSVPIEVVVKSNAIDAAKDSNDDEYKDEINNETDLEDEELPKS